MLISNGHKWCCTLRSFKRSRDSRKTKQANFDAKPLVRIKTWKSFYRYECRVGSQWSKNKNVSTIQTDILALFTWTKKYFFYFLSKDFYYSMWHWMKHGFVIIDVENQKFYSFWSFALLSCVIYTSHFTSKKKNISNIFYQHFWFFFSVRMKLSGDLPRCVRPSGRREVGEKATRADAVLYRVY